MTSDLFPDCRQDSPRLAWMMRNGIKAWPNEFSSGQWIAICVDWIASGVSQDCAIENVAELAGIPLWHEEDYMKEHK